MRWHSLDPDFGVLAIDAVPSNDLEKPEAPFELRVWWGGGEPTRAAWFYAGGLAAWVDVGEA